SELLDLLRVLQREADLETEPAQPLERLRGPGVRRGGQSQGEPSRNDQNPGLLVVFPLVRPDSPHDETRHGPPPLRVSVSVTVVLAPRALPPGSSRGPAVRRGRASRATGRPPAV